MRKIIFTIFIFISSSLVVYAQSDYEQMRKIYDNAEENYTIGRLDEAEQELTKNLKNFPNDLRQSAYRLLALCNLGNDNEEKAEEMTQQLLQENPYYSTSANDPQRFIDMVERIKAGRTATITTASSQAETLNEVPVPTTLITADMIKSCGGSNLQEVLAAYVPGMHIVDCNDDINIAMRGIYSNSQEKILIMVNGHRLNSYCTNIAAPDYSISLEKIKQIEVLRGPASSLYGGVSLTGVINIITWQGADIDGVKVKAGIGNHGQLRGDAMIGKRYFDVDFLLWASIYKAKGEIRYIDREDTGMHFDSGDITIGGIGKKPSYDVGLSLKYKDISFLYNTQYSQIQAPMTMMFFYSPYNIDKYKTFNGLRPGYTTQSHHADLSYSHLIGKVWLKGSIAYDNSDLTHYQVIVEEPTTSVLSLLPFNKQVQQLLIDKGGIYRYINGQEHTFSGKLQGDWSYVNNKNHKGNLSFGIEYSYFNLDDVRYTFGYEYANTLPEASEIQEYGKGHETNQNTFVQLKHQWKNFILNAGLRFDYKQRYDDSHIRELSPRVALIYMQPKWNVKLSYSKSFIDAPYLYRKTNLVLAKYFDEQDITMDLNPESLHSWQLTFNTVEWVKGLNFELNAFYNRAHDLIFLMFSEHDNAGEMNAYGLEFSGSYKTRKLSIHLNATWQDVKKNNLYLKDFDRGLNMPKFMANAIFSWKTPLKNLELHTHLSLSSKQETYHLDPINYSTYIDLASSYGKIYQEYVKNPTDELKERLDEMDKQMSYLAEEITVRNEYSARLLVNLGARYTIKDLELSFDIHNLFNHKYSQSGMSTGPIPQKGMWFMGSIAYKF